MLGEKTRQGLENPTNRVHNRRLLQPGFTKDAMAGYIDKVGGACRACTRAG